MSAAEVLAKHRYAKAACDGCCKSYGYPDRHAAHQIDALRAAGYEVMHVADTCAHCGEPIKWSGDFNRWFHPKHNGTEFCYRAPEHTEVATPKAAEVS